MNNRNFILSDKDEYQTSSDKTFSSMFEDGKLYCRLYKSVVGEELELLYSPLSQVSYPKVGELTQKKLDSICVDIQAEGKNTISTMDIQKNFTVGNITNRTVFYACRAYSHQSVIKGNYQNLKPAAITFVMSDCKTPTKVHPLIAPNDEVQKLAIGNPKTGKFSEDTLNIHLVFVPTVLENRKNNINKETDELYIFSSFFAIKNQVQADKFANDFGETELGGNLMTAYALAIEENERRFQETPITYFTQKEAELALAEKDEQILQQAQQAQLEKIETLKITIVMLRQAGITPNEIYEKFPKDIELIKPIIEEYNQNEQ